MINLNLATEVDGGPGGSRHRTSIGAFVAVEEVPESISQISLYDVESLFHFPMDFGLSWRGSPLQQEANGLSFIDRAWHAGQFIMKLSFSLCSTLSNQ